MPTNFDPFRSRLARDIRNNLSKAFLRALAENDISLFQKCGVDYLQQKPGSAYAQYVTSRLSRYQEAYEIIVKKELREILQQAAILWDLGLYFEMHELLEREWKEAEGDRRRALQGLIRAAGMKIHAENNNEKAAVNMGSKALQDLVLHHGELAGFIKLDVILADIRQTIGRIQSNARLG
jgi:hypothetical protein